MIFKLIMLLTLISGITHFNAAMAEEGMTSSLICPCECAMVISTCDCSTAIQIKKEIEQMKESSFSEKQIFSALQAEYGSDILVRPEKEKSIPLWLAPLILLFVFLGYTMTRKSNLEIIPDKKKYEEQFEEEYRKFVSEEEV